MPVRSWNNDTSELRVPIIPETEFADSLVVAMLINPSVNTEPFGTPLMTGYDSAGTPQWMFGIKANVPYFKTTNGSQTINPGTAGAIADDVWTLVAFTKSGTLGPRRFHILELGGSWVHDDGDLGGGATAPNATTGGFIGFGYNNVEATTPDLRWAIAAAGKTAPSDALVEALADGLSSQDWVDSEISTGVPTFGGAWNFDQTDAGDNVPDLLGRHATITGTISGGTDTNGISGTTIEFGDDPAGWDFTTVPPPLRVTFRYSGGAANSDPALSTGGAESSAGGVQAAGLDGVLLNVLPDFDRPAAIDGMTVYRGVYVHLEDNGFSAPADLIAWLDAPALAAGVTVAIGAAAEGPGGTMETLPDEETAPTGVTFSVPSSEGTAISLGETSANDGTGLWIRATVEEHSAGGLSNSVPIVVGVTPA